MFCSFRVRILYLIPFHAFSTFSENFLDNYPLFFHSANGVLHHYPFSRLILVVLFSLMRQIFLSCLLSVGYGRLLVRKVSPTSKIPNVRHADNLLWSCRRTLFIDAIVMPFSFLVACFVNDEAMVGDHKLSLRYVFSSCMNSTFPFFFQAVAFAVLCNR